MSDQVLASLPDVASGNSDYPQAQSAEWQIESVRAIFDGTGAGGPFLPALQIIGPGGKIAGTYVDRSTPIAAGAEADVTWGPF